MSAWTEINLNSKAALIFSLKHHQYDGIGKEIETTKHTSDWRVVYPLKIIFKEDQNYVQKYS